MGSNEHKNILIVEGKTDERIVVGLSQLLLGDRTPQFGIKSRSGAPNVFRRMASDITESRRNAVGFLLDTDANIADRWEAIVERIYEAHCSMNTQQSEPVIPSSPQVDGTIIDYSPRIGIWLMPNNRDGGEIEDFLNQMVRKDEVWKLSSKFINGIPREFREFGDHKVPKATFWAWLATRKKPGMVKEAMSRSNLDVNSPLAQDFAEWLRRVFE